MACGQRYRWNDAGRPSCPRMVSRISLGSSCGRGAGKKRCCKNNRGRKKTMLQLDATSFFNTLIWGGEGVGSLGLYPAEEPRQGSKKHIQSYKEIEKYMVLAGTNSVVRTVCAGGYSTSEEERQGGVTQGTHTDFTVVLPKRHELFQPRRVMLINSVS